MELKPLLKKNKKAQGLVMGLIAGVASLIIVTIVTLVAVDTVNNANLLGTWGQNTSATGGQVNSANTTQKMIGNFTSGIDNVSAKIPTILLIAAVIILFGAIVILVQRSRAMTAGGGGSL